MSRSVWPRAAEQASPDPISESDPQRNGKREPDPVKDRLPYKFDAMPRVLPLVKAERLKWVDLGVLLALLYWRKGMAMSCWTTVAIISDQTGLSERWVQYSIERLIAAGVIDRRKCGKIDPDDAKNRTGWRYHFLFATFSVDEVNDCGVQPSAPQTNVRGAAECTRGGAAECTQSEIGSNLDGTSNPDVIIPLANDTKAGVPPFASSLAAGREPKDFRSSKGNGIPLKTRDLTAREADEALREEAQSSQGRTPIDILGSATQEHEPFASEAPGMSKREMLIRDKTRRVAVHQTLHGKPMDQVVQDAMDRAKDPEELRWIIDELYKIKGA